MKRVREERIVGYTFILPACVGLGLFVIFPILWATYLSFRRWNLISPSEFVGFGQFNELFTDPELLNSFKCTFLFSGMIIPGQFIVSLSLALLLNAKYMKAEKIFRLAIFSPVVVSMVIVSIVWRFIYNPSFGFANFFLMKLGIPPQGWLTDVKQALPAIAVVTIWKAAGYYMLIFLAGLQAIPVQIYEAAALDGVTSWKRLVYITLPLLKGTSLFVLIITTIDSMRMFTQVYVMTQGGPAKSTYVLAMNIYRKAFVFMRMGTASAMAVILFLIIAVFVCLQWKYIKPYQYTPTA